MTRRRPRVVTGHTEVETERSPLATVRRNKVRLRVQVWLGDASNTARMCQRGNMKVLTQQAVTACMVFIVVGGDALTNS